MKYVIIGNGPAAIGCVEAIRRKDVAGDIIVYSKENEHTYSRPLISYLLSGQTDETKMAYRPLDFYEQEKVCFHKGTEVLGVDVKKKLVTASDGSRQKYDRLLLATGGRPFVPPAEGLDNVKYHTFMTLDDARNLRAALNKKSRVLIVGAGLIGLKCLEGINGIVSSVCVVDMASRVLPSILDEEAALMVQSHCEKQGVRFFLGDSVSSFTPGTAHLKSGREIPFDVLVMAVGVRPNTNLAIAMGLDAARGIPTDKNGFTGLPGVYAAGDCAQSYDISADTHRVLALLPNAYMQGEVCGESMSGDDVKLFNAFPMNAMGLFGLHMITAGTYTEEGRILRGENWYKRLCVKDNRLMGYILVGDVERAGIYTALIREKTPLDSVDFELMLEKPQLMAFSKRDRQIRLGGQRL